MENWKQSTEIPRLEISDSGNVRCFKTKRKWYTKSDKLGYECGQYRTSRKRISFKVHRLVAKEFLNNSNNYSEVNHIDGNKMNNAATNLEWCTRSYNLQHSFKTGLRTNSGENNPRSKLTEDLVRKVCIFFEESDKNTPSLAVVKFGISMQQATKIRSKKAWVHISKDFTFVPLRK